MRNVSLAVVLLAAVASRPAASAERPVVGVVDFDNLAGGLAWWHAGTGRDLAASLSQQLAATGSLSIMDRLEVAEAQNAESTARSAGAGSRYLVRAAVAYYSERGSSRSSSIRIKGVNIRGRARGAQIAVDFEVADLASGALLHAATLDSRTGGLDLDIGYYEPELSGELSRYRNQPAGKALAKAIAEIAHEIERVLMRAATEDRVAVAAVPSGGRSPSSTEAVADAPERVAASIRPDAPANVSANYDFEPGSRVLFEDDFSSTPIGDFPHRLRFKSGEMEVVRWNGRYLLRAQGGRQDHFEIPLPETLPERFTLEFDIHDASSLGGDVDRLGVYFGRPPANGFSLTRPGGAPHVRVSNADGLGIFTYIHEPISSVEAGRTALSEGLLRIQVQVDGGAVKVYADQQRIANVPEVDLGRSDAVTFLIQAQKDPTYIGGIRLAAGGRDLYSVLQVEGRVAIRDILFDIGSARIQASSAATLVEIAAMLRRHPGLRLRIEGHTDDTGGAAANLSLSRQRAEAIRDHLVSHEGIDGSRLGAVGLGEDHPVADNGTEAGRALNRRVELVSTDTP